MLQPEREVVAEVKVGIHCREKRADMSSSRTPVPQDRSWRMAKFTSMCFSILSHKKPVTNYSHTSRRVVVRTHRHCWKNKNIYRVQSKITGSCQHHGVNVLTTLLVQGAGLNSRLAPRSVAADAIMSVPVQVGSLIDLLTTTCANPISTSRPLQGS